MAMARRWTPQRFVTLRRIRVIACIAATSIALAGSFAFTARKSVALNINGQTTQVTTYAMTATRLLEEQGVDIKTHDIVTASSGDQLANHAVVTVQSAYQTTINIDGTVRAVLDRGHQRRPATGIFRGKPEQRREDHRRHQERVQPAHRRPGHQPVRAGHRHRRRQKLRWPPMASCRPPPSSIPRASCSTRRIASALRKDSDDDHSARTPRDPRRGDAHSP